MSVYYHNISPIRNDHSAISREIDASAFDLVILIELFKETDCTLREARKPYNLKNFNPHLYAHNVALFIRKDRHFQLIGNTDFLVQFKTHNLTFSVGYISTKFKECKVPNAEHHISSFIKSEEASAKQSNSSLGILTCISTTTRKLEMWYVLHQKMFHGRKIAVSIYNVFGKAKISSKNRFANKKGNFLDVFFKFNNCQIRICL